MSEEKIRVLKTASCPSLSSRSELTYEIGCKEDKSIHIRITGNTGAGLYSKGWIQFESVTTLLSAEKKPISSRTIKKLYSGSVNTCGFLLAILRHIGIIRNTEENSRDYAYCGTDEFLKDIKGLMDGKDQPAAAKVKSKKSGAPMPELG